MAKGDEVTAVFEILEKVFNPEIVFEYDEALEELGLHTAKVRKTYPNLFKALQFPSRVIVPGSADSGQLASEMFVKIMEELKLSPSNGRRVHSTPLPMYIPPPPQDKGAVPLPIEVVEDTEAAIKIMPYSEWAQGPARFAQVGQEYVYRWDIADVPAKQVTETFVLKNREDGGRTRFHVIAMVDDMSYQVKVVSILPAVLSQ